MNDYLKHQERINELVEKKKELYAHIKKKRQVQAKYMEYLKNNPYKKEFYKLTQEEHKKRSALMNLIPNQWVN